jgi:hypothetical protein
MTSSKNEDGIWVVYDKIKCDRYSFDTSADDLKSYVDQIVAEAKEKGMVGNGTFDFEVHDGYYGSYSLDVKYYFDRAENNKERTDRESAEAKVKADAAAKRKAAAEKEAEE